MKYSGLLQGDWLNWIFSLELLANGVDHSMPLKRLKIKD